MRSRIMAGLVSVALAFAINGVAPASVAAASGSSDPAALAILDKAEAMLSPDVLFASVRRLFTPAVQPHDGTPTMVALTRALPRLSPTDQARARVLLRTTSRGADSNLCGEFSGTPYNKSTTDDGHFVIYYTSKQSSPNYATEAYVNRVESVLAKVWATEIDTMGYPAPRPPLGNSATPIYLCNLSLDLYGYCNAADPQIGATAAAVCTLRNNYNNPEFAQNGSTPLMALQVTAAHEFFHAVQFGMNGNTPMWPAEGSAVWMENEVYPTSHDYLQYMSATGIQNPSVPFNVAVSSADSDTGATWTYTPYGDGIFFRFLSDWLKDVNAVRQFWTYLADHPNRAPLNALISVLSTHHRTLAMAMTQWAIWNTLPPNSYPNRGLYMPVGWWKNVARDRGNRSFTSGAATVRPLADRPLHIHRGRNVAATTRLKFTVIGPGRASGGWFTYRVRMSNGSNATHTSPMPANGIASVTVPFGTSVTDIFITVNNLASIKRTFQVRASVLGR